MVTVHPGRIGLKHPLLSPSGQEALLGTERTMRCSCGRSECSLSEQNSLPLQSQYKNQQLLLRTFLVSSKSLDIGSLLGMTCRWCQPFPLINKLLRTSLGRRRDAAHQPISEVLGLKLAETRGGCLLQGPSLVPWLLAACPVCVPLGAASPAFMCHPPHTLVAGFCCH